MDHNLIEAQNYLRRIDSLENEIEVHTCAECGEGIKEGVRADDLTGDYTYFCFNHLPKCEIGRSLWIDKWYKRYVPDMSLRQRGRIVISEFSCD